ncbi:MAG TPA: hypothetical protein VI032_09185 [Burkholderiaceae bacterium]
MLKNLLIVRAVFNLLFGIVLVFWMEHEVLRGIGRGGFYLLGDGVLTLAIAAALRGLRPSLAMITAADGLLRLGAGAFIYANPGLEKMVMTTALFLVVVSIGFITLGIVGLAIVWLGARKVAAGAAAAAPAWPPAAIALCTLLLGVGIAISFFDQQLRLILVGYMLMVGVLLGYTAWRLPASSAAASAGVAG